MIHEAPGRSETVIVPSNRVHVRKISRILQLSKQQQPNKTPFRIPNSHLFFILRGAFVVIHCASVPSSFRFQDVDLHRRPSMESLAPTELSRSSSASTTLLHVMSAWHSPGFVVVKEDRERHVLSEKRCCCYWSVVGLDEHLDTFGAQYPRADQNTLRPCACNSGFQRWLAHRSPQIPTDPNPGYLLIFVSTI